MQNELNQHPRYDKGVELKGRWRDVVGWLILLCYIGTLYWVASVYWQVLKVFLFLGVFLSLSFLVVIAFKLLQRGEGGDYG